MLLLIRHVFHITTESFFNSFFNGNYSSLSFDTREVFEAKHVDNFSLMGRNKGTDLRKSMKIYLKDFNST